MSKPLEHENRIYAALDEQRQEIEKLRRQLATIALDKAIIGEVLEETLEQNRDLEQQLAEAKTDTKRFYAGFCELHRKDGSCDLEQEYLKVNQQLADANQRVKELERQLAEAQKVISETCPIGGLDLVTSLKTEKQMMMERLSTLEASAGELRLALETIRTGKWTESGDRQGAAYSELRAMKIADNALSSTSGKNYMDRMAALEASAGEMRLALEKAANKVSQFGVVSCYVCGRAKDLGHNDWCPIGKVLSSTGQRAARVLELAREWGNTPNANKQDVERRLYAAVKDWKGAEDAD